MELKVMPSIHNAVIAVKLILPKAPTLKMVDITPMTPPKKKLRGSLLAKGCSFLMRMIAVMAIKPTICISTVAR